MGFTQDIKAGIGFAIPFTGDAFKRLVSIYNKHYSKSLIIAAPEGELDFGQVDFFDAFELQFEMQFKEVEVVLYQSEGDRERAIVVLEKNSFGISDRYESQAPIVKKFAPSDELLALADEFNTDVGLVFFSSIN